MAKSNGEWSLVPRDPVLQFLQSVWQLEHALERASKHMEDSLGVSGRQRFALRIIGGFPGITAGDLAAVLHLHPSTVTGIVQRLEARRLVRRQSNSADGRVAHLHLTRAGRRTNAPSAPGTIEHAARATLARCPAARRRAALQLLSRFTRELTNV
jgi:DNA-binding MarR family transcriptional regulator